MIKVLSAIVIPPHMSVSGGARAGEQLSAALMPYCDVSVATMMTITPSASPLKPGNSPKRLTVTSKLPPFVPWSKIPHKFSTLFYRSNIPNLIAAGGYDIVHIHNPMPALEMQRVAAQCLISRVPYVVHTHGFNEIANGQRVYKFDRARSLVWRAMAEKPVSFVVRNAAGVFALSDADTSIVRAMGYKGNQLSIVPNGVTMPSLTATPTDAEALLKLGVPATGAAAGLTYFFLANHTPNKGLPILLEAFAAMTQPFTLVVGGEKRGEIDYDTYIRRCKPGQRIIVTGRLSDAEVAVVLRRADMFVFPTLADTFPLVVLEAMSYGVPVIASRIGGIPHQLQGDCGEIVAAGEPQALRGAIEHLSNDPERLAAIGARARARAAAVYSWDGAARAAVSGYERILGRRAAPAPVAAFSEAG
jgi:alpha-maltose-1-phosphate synthase